MPARTHGEKIDELTQVTLSLRNSVANIQDSIQGIRQELSEIRDKLHSLETRVAVLENKVQHIEEELKDRSRKIWMIAGPIIGAAAGALATYLVKR